MIDKQTGQDRRCARCGADEFRVDGYCSVECRDMHEVEVERDRLREAITKHKERTRPGQTTPKLLPCPFCGHRYVSLTTGVNEWWVRCPSCDASAGMCNEERQAVEAWNTRAPVVVAFDNMDCR